MNLKLSNNKLVKIVYLILTIAICIDVILPVLTIINPLKWFNILHPEMSIDKLHLAFLYRSAAHWTAFNIIQIIAIIKWRKDLYWLAVTAGVRFSDILTDLTYWFTAPNLSEYSWTLLVPPLLNIVMGLFLLIFYIHLKKQGLNKI